MPNVVTPSNVGQTIQLGAIVPNIYDVNVDGVSIVVSPLGVISTSAVLTVQNGLNSPLPNIGELGGLLLHDTQIDQVAFDFSINRFNTPVQTSFQQNQNFAGLGNEGIGFQYNDISNTYEKVIGLSSIGGFLGARDGASVGTESASILANAGTSFSQLFLQTISSGVDEARTSYSGSSIYDEVIINGDPFHVEDFSGFGVSYKAVFDPSFANVEAAQVDITAFTGVAEANLSAKVGHDRQSTVALRGQTSATMECRSLDNRGRVILQPALARLQANDSSNNSQINALPTQIQLFGLNLSVFGAVPPATFGVLPVSDALTFLVRTQGTEFRDTPINTLLAPNIITVVGSISLPVLAYPLTVFVNNGAANVTINIPLGIRDVSISRASGSTGTVDIVYQSGAGTVENALGVHSASVSLSALGTYGDGVRFRVNPANTAQLWRIKNG